MRAFSAQMSNSVSVARIETLDGVRGLAALTVVLWHVVQLTDRAHELRGSRWDEWLHFWPLRLLWGGEEAVIAFFVMSGLVLALPFLRPNRPLWSRFALRRVLRLYPPYLAAFLISASCAWLLAPGRSAEQLQVFGLHWSGNLGLSEFFYNVLMINEVQPTNIALWSIVQEMRISLIFPLLFALTIFLGIPAALSLSALLAAGLSYGALERHWLADWGLVLISFYRTPMYIFFFILGIALAQRKDTLLRYLSGPGRTFRLPLGIVGLGALGTYDNLPYGVGALLVGMGFATILMVVMSTDRGNLILMSAMPQFLGRISFSLYLLHLPVLLSMLRLLFGVLPFMVIMVAAIPMSVVVAWLFWYIVERPSISLSRRVLLG